MSSREGKVPRAKLPQFSSKQTSRSLLPPTCRLPPMPFHLGTSAVAQSDLRTASCLHKLLIPMATITCGIASSVEDGNKVIFRTKSLLHGHKSSSRRSTTRATMHLPEVVAKLLQATTHRLARSLGVAFLLQSPIDIAAVTPSLIERLALELAKVDTLLSGPQDVQLERQEISEGSDGKSSQRFQAQVRLP